MWAILGSSFVLSTSKHRLLKECCTKASLFAFLLLAIASTAYLQSHDALNSKPYTCHEGEIVESNFCQGSQQSLPLHYHSKDMVHGVSKNYGFLLGVPMIRMIVYLGLN